VLYRREKDKCAGGNNPETTPAFQAENLFEHWQRIHEQVRLINAAPFDCSARLALQAIQHIAAVYPNSQETFKIQTISTASRSRTCRWRVYISVQKQNL
jgi:hypothetical protein